MVIVFLKHIMEEIEEHIQFIDEFFIRCVDRKG